MVFFLSLLFLTALGQGIFKYCSDALMSGKFQSTFIVKDDKSFFGINSWTRKYKGGIKTNGDAYFLSSSLLVWTTDGWHLSNALGMICNISSLLLLLVSDIHFTLLYALIIALCFWFIRSAVHHILFTYLHLFIKPKSQT